MQKTTILLLLSMLPFVCCFADEKNDGQQNRPAKIVLNRERTPIASGPRMPGRAVLNCEYGEGYIYIQLPDWAESAEVTVSENEMPVWFCTMTPQDNTAELPALNGEYTITCELDDQSTYVGILVF